MAKQNQGINNVDTKDMEQMRTKVVEQELSARSWKAYYEKMYYSLEAEKLEKPYKELQERMNERIKKEKEEYEAFIKKMQETLKDVNVDNPLGEVAIEEKETTPVIQMN